MKQLLEVAIISHAAGFIMGAVITYVVLRAMKKALLETPATTITMQDLREWLKRDIEIRELNHVTRECLDKIAHLG